MRKCDSCGKLYQESKDVFCPHCGAVAQKQCTHSSSFDSKRYDRGEIYKNNKTQYHNTSYKQGTEPHAQRENAPYNKSKNTTVGYGDKAPKINLPDFKKVFSNGKPQNGKFIGIIIFVIVLLFNFITGFIGSNDIFDDTGSWEDVNGIYAEEDINEFYTVVNEAKIELVETDGDYKTFTLEIKGISFDEYLPDNVQNDILSGAMAEAILSEDTYVEMLVCNFQNKIVTEDNYSNAVDESYNNPGKHIGDKCKYEFNCSFDYGEIVHIVNGVSFYLGDNSYINAELPFSAFSVSKNGKITYYTSYADSETEWNTVFSESSNQQDFDSGICIDFDSLVTIEGE